MAGLLKFSFFRGGFLSELLDLVALCLQHVEDSLFPDQMGGADDDEVGTVGFQIKIDLLDHFAIPVVEEFFIKRIEPLVLPEFFH